MSAPDPNVSGLPQPKGTAAEAFYRQDSRFSSRFRAMGGEFPRREQLGKTNVLYPSGHKSEESLVMSSRDFFDRDHARFRDKKGLNLLDQLVSRDKQNISKSCDRLTSSAVSEIRSSGTRPLAMRGPRDADSAHGGSDAGNEKTPESSPPKDYVSLTPSQFQEQINRECDSNPGMLNTEEILKLKQFQKMFLAADVDRARFMKRVHLYRRLFQLEAEEEEAQDEGAYDENGLKRRKKAEKQAGKKAAAKGRTPSKRRKDRKKAKQR